MSKERIGLFGGSFDPPHLGHEALVREALSGLALDEVWVIPAGVPVHRQLTTGVNPAKRLEWSQTVFGGIDRVRIMDWEFDRTAPVAAIETLWRFQHACENVVPLWLSGADSYATLPGWVEYPVHRKLCNIAVFPRVGESPPEVLDGWQLLSRQEWLSSETLPAGHVIPVDVGLPDISATRIRERASQGMSLEGMVNADIVGEVASLYKI